MEWKGIMIRKIQGSLGEKLVVCPPVPFHRLKEEEEQGICLLQVLVKGNLIYTEQHPKHETTQC